MSQFDYEERNKLSITATLDCYKEIDAAVEAMLVQGRWIEKHANLLKVLHAHTVDQNLPLIDVHLSVLYHQLQKMNDVTKELTAKFNEDIERQKKMELEYQNHCASLAR